MTRDREPRLEGALRGLMLFHPQFRSRLRALLGLPIVLAYALFTNNPALLASAGVAAALATALLAAGVLVAAQRLGFSRRGLRAALAAVLGCLVLPAAVVGATAGRLGEGTHWVPAVVGALELTICFLRVATLGYALDRPLAAFAAEGPPPPRPDPLDNVLRVLLWLIFVALELLLRGADTLHERVRLATALYASAFTLAVPLAVLLLLDSHAELRTAAQRLLRGIGILLAVGAPILSLAAAVFVETSWPRAWTIHLTIANLVLVELAMLGRAWFMEGRLPLLSQWWLTAWVRRLRREPD